MFVNFRDELIICNKHKHQVYGIQYEFDNTFYFLCCSVVFVLMFITKLKVKKFSYKYILYWVLYIGIYCCQNLKEIMLNFGNKPMLLQIEKKLISKVNDC